MFERFTAEARDLVIDAQMQARRLRSPDIRATHLLLALTRTTSPAARSLRDSGADADAVEKEMKRLRRPAGRDDDRPLDEQDGAALADIGVDLDAIRAAVEARFGEGALDRHPRRRGPGPLRRLLGRRRTPGAHIPFHAGARKTLELSLHEAIRLGDRHLGPTHLALGLLRADDPAVRSILFTLGVDVAALRRRLEGPGRRTA